MKSSFCDLFFLFARGERREFLEGMKTVFLCCICSRRCNWVTEIVSLFTYFTKKTFFAREKNKKRHGKIQQVLERFISRLNVGNVLVFGHMISWSRAHNQWKAKGKTCNVTRDLFFGRLISTYRCWFCWLGRFGGCCMCCGGGWETLICDGCIIWWWGWIIFWQFSIVPLRTVKRKLDTLKSHKITRIFLSRNLGRMQMQTMANFDAPTSPILHNMEH